MRRWQRFGMLAALAFLIGCADDGDKITGTPDPIEFSIDDLRPARTVVGDTVDVIGSGFGAAQSGLFATFTGAQGARVDAPVVLWSDERVRVLVPSGTVDGPLRIVAPEQDELREAPFSVAPALVRFSQDVHPLFQAGGCISCHGGSGGLNVGTPADLLEGGNHGPAVIPRDSETSILVRKIGPSPPFGDRMPQGCSGDFCLSPGEILSISDWIDQGVRDN